MGLIFFTTILPVGLFMRARGHDPLRLKREPQSSSYWIEREPPWPGARHDDQPVLRRSSVEFVTELWRFMRARKKFWLLPILVMTAVFGGLIVLTKGSAVAPFIYTLF